MKATTVQDPIPSPARPEALPVLARQSLAGALGGLLTFLFRESAAREAELRHLEPQVGELLLLGAYLGALITTLLLTAEEWGSRRIQRLLLRGGLAGLAGAVLGALSILLGQLLYHGPSQLADATGLVPLQIIARTLGWSVFGLGIGLGPGLVTGSSRRLSLGLAGGALGGAVGGGLFDVVSLPFGIGTLGRFVGFTVLGGCVGFFTALVEQWKKRAWVTFLTGSREGREVILHRPICVLGRDELIDVPLFGDPGVARRHAAITLEPVPSIRLLDPRLPPDALLVDGQPMREAALVDGSLLRIGSHRLRFHHREVRAVARAAEPVPFPLSPPPAAPARRPAPDERTLLLPADRPAPTLTAPLPVTHLRVLTGPTVGTRVALSPPFVTLGRENGNTLVLPDSRISRRHLRLEHRDEVWLLVDLQSTNGTFLNGLRISRAGLCPGDQIGVGDSLLVVEGSLA